MSTGMYRPRGATVRRLVVPQALPRRRVVALVSITSLVALCLIARLVTLQVTPPKRLLEWSYEKTSRQITVPADRGEIVDRNNRELAMTAPAKSVAVNPQMITDIPTVSLQLSNIFAVSVTDLQTRLTEAKEKGQFFAYIARQVEDTQAAEALGLGLPTSALFTIDESRRVRPAGDAVGEALLGATNVDNVGQSGLEKQYESYLHGTDGKLIVEEGTKGRTIPGAPRTGVPSVPGSTLVLSLDRALQFDVDQLVQRAVEQSGAQYGIAIVSKIGTSEILANSVVKLNPQTGKAAPVAENRAVTWGFEPGSVMKSVTLSALLDTGTVTLDTTLDVPDSLRLYDVTYADDEYHQPEHLSALQIVQQSSNVGTIMMAQQLPSSKLHQYLTRFGFGSPTGLGFPGEHPGFVGDYRRWTGVTGASYAIGQGILVTPMQMLMSLNTIANKGVYVSPKYVLGRETADGKFIAEPAGDRRQVISADTAAKVTTVLESVVTGGTGVNAQIAGYTVAGKTGTAWEAQANPMPGDGYRDIFGYRHLTSSFMGFLPAEDPQISIMVILDDLTNTNSSGGKVSAPVFSSIADIATRLLNIPPTTDAAASAVRVRSTPEQPPAPPTIPGAEPSTTAPAVVNPAAALKSGPVTTVQSPTTTAKVSPTTQASAPPTTSRPPTTRAPAGGA